MAGRLRPAAGTAAAAGAVGVMVMRAPPWPDPPGCRSRHFLSDDAYGSRTDFQHSGDGFAGDQVVSGDRVGDVLLPVVDDEEVAAVAADPTDDLDRAVVLRPGGADPGPSP